jgi:hypothetical protein
MTHIPVEKWQLNLPAQSALSFAFMAINALKNSVLAWVKI